MKPNDLQAAHVADLYLWETKQWHSDEPPH